MISQVLHTVRCNISGGAAGEIWNWSLLGVKGLKCLFLSVMKNKAQTRLHQALHQHQQFAAVRAEKTHETLLRVERAVNSVFSRMKLNAPRFGFADMSPCSLYEVKSAQEVDLLCCVKLLDPADVSLDENQVPAGSARVCPKTKTALDNWQDLCGRAASGQEFLSAEKLVAELAKRLLEAVKCLTKQDLGPEVVGVAVRTSKQQATLVVKLIGDDNIRVNILPVIALRGLWPATAHDFEAQLARLPPADRRRVADSCGVLLVAKPVQSCSEFLWRMWFSEVERALLYVEKHGCQGFCMRVLNDLHQTHLEPASLLGPYHFQTLLLCEYFQHPYAEDWTQEKLPERIMGLLSSLKRMLKKRSWPHVFLSGVDLFPRCDSTAARKLETKVASILKDPASFVHPGIKPCRERGHVSVTCNVPADTSSGRVQINIDLQSGKAASVSHWLGNSARSR